MSRRRRPNGAPLHHRPAALRFARRSAGMTWRQLAERVGVSESLLHDFATGHRSARPELLKEIAEVLDCPVEVLVADTTPHAKGAAW
ncbi:helix-turn-helix domain-containing protein [Streptomyces diastaticus]|uniref:helix-turn-helix domain-containing protein n=1 Tax=Streptomyces diastaticus TaxID=1956 RepID=UPI003650666A